MELTSQIDSPQQCFTPCAGRQCYCPGACSSDSWVLDKEGSGCKGYDPAWGNLSAGSLLIRRRPTREGCCLQGAHGLQLISSACLW